MFSNEVKLTHVSCYSLLLLNRSRWSHNSFLLFFSVHLVRLFAFNTLKRRMALLLCVSVCLNVFRVSHRSDRSILLVPTSVYIYIASDSLPFFFSLFSHKQKIIVLRCAYSILVVIFFFTLLKTHVAFILIYKFKVFGDAARIDERISNKDQIEDNWKDNNPEKWVWECLNLY